MSQLKKGVYIEGVNSRLYSASDWDGSVSANSIVVIDDRTRFRISLIDNYVTIKISNEGTTPIENVLPIYSTTEEAKLDFNALANTEGIISLIPGTDYAAGYCYYGTWFPNQNQAVLPSLGWLSVAYDNLSEINSCLSKCGGNNFSEDHNYASSTYSGIAFNTQRCTWGILCADGSVSMTPILLSGRYIRAFAEY